ncbi:hypothetical protein GCM10023205_81840 [Yinghuangia aomiensis]|uniref:Aminoglycoside phosphotransferase domain-containing protein n=1 Tax=Yinghuangia aomiensis TaxID=676205 RepID=A0ABP9IEX9_9ACTN
MPAKGEPYAHGWYNDVYLVDHSTMGRTRWSVNRVAHVGTDPYDLAVLPPRAMYDAVRGRSQMAWLPSLIYEWIKDGSLHQELTWLGSAASDGPAGDRAMADVGFAECCADLLNLDTSELEALQTSAIDQLRDPARQEQPLVFEGASTWEEARIALLRRLLGEVDRRLPLERYGAPAFDQLWQLLRPLLPSTATDGPPRIVHHDGKYENLLIAGRHVGVIDWDFAAVTRMAPEHAAVVDLARMLHLTGRNPLLTSPDIWRATAERWVSANPEAAPAVRAFIATPGRSGSNPCGYLAQESVLNLASSVACGILRASEGSYRPELAARTLTQLLGVVGLPAPDAQQLDDDLRACRFSPMAAWNVHHPGPPAGPFSQHDRDAGFAAALAAVELATAASRHAQTQAMWDLAARGTVSACEQIARVQSAVADIDRVKDASPSNVLWPADARMRRANQDRLAVGALRDVCDIASAGCESWAMVPGLPDLWRTAATTMRPAAPEIGPGFRPTGDTCRYVTGSSGTGHSARAEPDRQASFSRNSELLV